MADLRGCEVMVVDDKPDARVLTLEMLRQCGAQVRSASSAQEALTLLERSTPDVLVLDIGMPEVDGFELLRRVRSRPAPVGLIKALALTAFTRAEDRDRARGAGFDDFVQKPVHAAQLTAAVAALWRMARFKG